VVRYLERRDWFWGLVLIGFIFVAYARVFHAGFIWDDESHLTQNPCVVGPLGIKEIWTTARAVYYPLVLTTFWMVHKFAGLSPLPYHFLNVLIHAASALLLWRVLRQLGVRGAWLGAALWALHPVMVQSVAWVTELKNTQSCFFYLLSISLFLTWDKQPRPKSGLALALSLAAFVLATLSKPSVVMLPGVLALCVWWTRGRIRWQDAVPLAPYVVVSAVASAWTIWEQKFHAGAVGPDWALSWPERLILAGRAIWFYLGKLIWPHPLIFIYPRWQIHDWQLAAYLPLILAITALIVLCLVPGKAIRAVLFASFYYVISLFPVLGFFTIFFFRYSFVSDHFQYLASMGPLALLGAGIAVAASLCRGALVGSLSGGTEARRHSPVATTLFMAFCALLLLVIGFLTWRQTGEYRDLTTLYRSTLTKNPNCWMAHYNLGIVLSEHGNTDEAITHYSQAIALRPDYAEAHYNLGRLLAEKGQLDAATFHYEKALQINPTDSEAHNNLGVTLFGMGRVDDAVIHYRRALELRPDYAEASCNLANALAAKGDIDGAIDRYLACLAMLPDQAEAQYNVASALLRQGRIDEALVHFQKAIELNPQSANAHANVGSALLAKGRIGEAIDEYRKSLQISPENVAAQTNLAWLLATSPDPSARNGTEAVALAEQACRSSGGTTPVIQRILAAAYAEAGRFEDAKQAARQALQAADSQGNSALSGFLRKEIALYEAGRPYHKDATQ
jgi:tetratricopeptide (TPR) repeat protein